VAKKRHWLQKEIEELYPDAWVLVRVGAVPGAPLTEYLVVDELEEDVAVLVVEPWPELDTLGRLNFVGSELRTDVEVDVTEFEALLRNRAPLNQLTEEQRAAFIARPLRVGDVFCAVIDRGLLDAGPDQPSRWLQGPVIDVSAEARQAAKAQYFAAVGPVLDSDQVAGIAADFFADPERG
jgi:hypothetical protein